MEDSNTKKAATAWQEMLEKIEQFRQECMLEFSRQCEEED